MTNQFIKVPDIAYSINGDLIEPDNTARMGEVVKAELMELLEAIGDHWEHLSNKREFEIDEVDQAQGLHQKALSICRIAGCNLDDEPANAPSVTSALPVANNAQASLLEAQS